MSTRTAKTRSVARPRPTLHRLSPPPQRPRRPAPRLKVDVPALLVAVACRHRGPLRYRARGVRRAGEATSRHRASDTDSRGFGHGLGSDSVAVAARSYSATRSPISWSVAVTAPPLIEIERADTPILTRASEPTAPFNHACLQVRDWQRYIRENVRTVRSEQGWMASTSPTAR